jgi:pyruvate dehydrogenase E1 component alpha subunit
MNLPKEELLSLYRKMLLVRRMEEKHTELLASGKIWMMAHLGTGQEGVAIGMTAPLRKDDYLFPTHRGVGEFIGKGMDPRDIWAEYYGRSAGICHGKGGLHLADAKIGILGLVGSLGADFSVSAGTALSSKMRGTDQVTLCYFGEGTSNQADFHPMLNMAAVWELPLVLVCANNQYSELANFRVTTSTEDIAPRAAGYGIPWKIVEDGNDVLAVYEAVAEAIEFARTGKGPFFLEFKTYRIAPHFSGDPAAYQPKEEIEEWKKKDPILKFTNRLLSDQIVTNEDLETINQSVMKEVEEAVAYAQALPPAMPDVLFEDVFA